MLKYNIHPKLPDYELIKLKAFELSFIHLISYIFNFHKSMLRFRSEIKYYYY